MFNSHSTRSAEGGAAPVKAVAVSTRSAASLIEEISQEENELRAVLADILSRRPARDGAQAAQPPVAVIDVLTGGDLTAPMAPYLSPSGEGFSWRSEKDETAAKSNDPDSDLQSGTYDAGIYDEVTDVNVPPAGALQWLARARNARRWSNARQIGAWCLTIGVVGGLIAVTAYVITGNTLDLHTLLSAGMSRIF